MTLFRAPGPVRVRASGHERALASLEPRARGRASALFAEGRPLISCVEHLFAAVGALGIGRDLVVETSADELPLLGGGALEWADALATLFGDEAPQRPALVVVREGLVCVGPSEYRFTPGDGRRVASHFESAHPLVTHDAAWDGDADDFRARIAPARTFVEERELAAMMAAGQSATAEPESVVILGERAVHSAGRAVSADEPSRHKLLDLIGDLALHGGPPRGAVAARRPGHAATHVAVGRAIDEGLLAREP